MILLLGAETLGIEWCAAKENAKNILVFGYQITDFGLEGGGIPIYL